MAIIIDPVFVEPMRRADIDHIAEIEQRSYSVPWHENAYTTELTNPNAIYLVARMGEAVVGYAGMWVIMDEGHVTTIAVDPRYRGRKIGDKLMLGMMEDAIARGATRATLEVREKNVVAQNLYRKYGFREAAVRKKYYTDNQENAVIMWADEIRSPAYRERLVELRRQLYRAHDERTGFGD